LDVDQISFEVDDLILNHILEPFLDIGIGNAEVPEHCQQKQNKKIVVDGIDISKRLIEEHKDKYSQLYNLDLDNSDWTKQLEKKYNVVVASEMIEHLFRPDIFLEKVKAVLEPGGFLLISTPNLLLWSQRIRFLFGQHGYSEKGVFEWGHIHLFSWGFLKKQIVEHNYQLIETDHLMHPNYLNSLNKFLPGLFAFQFIILLKKS